MSSMVAGLGGTYPPLNPNLPNNYKHFTLRYDGFQVNYHVEHFLKRRL